MRTSDDGSFRVELAPGCYIIEDAESGRSAHVGVQGGETKSVLLSVPR